MSTYEYRCNDCGRRFEKTMPIAQHQRHPKPACPKCGSKNVEQLPSSFQAVTGKKT